MQEILGMALANRATVEVLTSRTSMRSFRSWPYHVASRGALKIPSQFRVGEVLDVDFRVDLVRQTCL